MTTGQVAALLAGFALVVTLLGAVWKFGQQIGQLTGEIVALTKEVTRLNTRVDRMEGATHGRR